MDNDNLPVIPCAGDNEAINQAVDAATSYAPAAIAILADADGNVQFGYKICAGANVGALAQLLCGTEAAFRTVLKLLEVPGGPVQ